MDNYSYMELVNPLALEFFLAYFAGRWISSKFMKDNHAEASGNGRD